VTTNQMTAVSFLLVENEEDGDESVKIVEHEVTGYSYNPVGYVVGISRDETVSHPLGSISDACDIMTLCNDARLFIKEDDSIFDIPENPSIDVAAAVAAARFAIEGEPTEAALLCLVEKLGPRKNNEEIGRTQSYLPDLASQNYEFFSSRWDRYATLDFDRKRKSMGVLVAERRASQTKMADDSERNRRCRLLVKGAPGSLLDRCSHAKLRDGCIIPISSEVRDRMQSTISSIGDRALRCIALAVKEGDSLDANLLLNNKQYDEALRDSSKYIDIESGLTFVGLVAIKDPPRPGVSKSIELCKRAGIRIIMITGDAKATAVAIAKDVHIFSEHNEDNDATIKAFESRDFFAMPHPVQLKILKNDNVVICRAEPADKRRIVKMLQYLGEIPAMTGKFQYIYNWFVYEWQY
jgi:magnesium-transporting ATPase (P-type)